MDLTVNPTEVFVSPNTGKMYDARPGSWFAKGVEDSKLSSKSFMEDFKRGRFIEGAGASGSEAYWMGRLHGQKLVT